MWVLGLLAHQSESLLQIIKHQNWFKFYYALSFNMYGKSKVVLFLAKYHAKKK